MHERTALRAREDRGVDLLGKGDGLRFTGGGILLGDLVLAEDQTAARTAKRLVRGGGDDIGIGNGVHVNAGGDKTGNVSHVDHEVSADGIGDLAELGKIDRAGIGGGAGKDHLGLALLRDAVDLVIIEHLRLVVEGVGNLMEVLTGNVDRASVGEMTAVSEVKTHVGVARLEHRLEGGKVRGSAGVRLDVGVLGAEELAGALAGDLLRLIDAVAAAVVTLAGIALGILVGQAGAHGQHDGGRDDILGSDQFNVALLTLIFLLYGCAHFGVVLSKEVHGFGDHFAVPP